ncbi:MAG: hypothetical protein Q9188_005148, partial [Gyalolechia gomerana]
MDQIPLRHAEDPHGQGIRSTMETMRFTKPSAFSFSQIVRGQQNHDGHVPGYTSLRTEGEIHIKVSDRAASEQSIWVENEIRSHDPSLAHIAANENGMT